MRFARRQYEAPAPRFYTLRSCFRSGGRRAGAPIALVVIGLLSVLSIGLATPLAAAASLNLATPQVLLTASTSTIVGLQIFANVNLTGDASPTGTVTFKLFGPSDASCTSAIFTSTVAVSGTSFNSDRFSTTMAGTYRWEASYGGNSNNNVVPPTVCSNPSAAVIVSRVDVGLSIHAQALAAGMLRATATVGGFAPSGTVTFYLAGPSDTFCSAPSVFSSTVTVTGIGTYTSGGYPPSATGTYKWRAIYSGDQNNQGGAITACLDSNAAVTVSALGGSPVASVGSAALTFGAQTVGTASPGQNVTLSNTGTAGLGITAVNITGANAADFRASGACTGTTLAPGASCTVAISFAPGSIGSSSAGLAFVDNATPNTQTVQLTGQSVASQGKFIYPSNGQMNVDTHTAFTWSSAPTAQQYYLVLGTTPGGRDLGPFALLPPTQSSYLIGGLPAGTIYATLFAQVNGSWTTSDAVSFTAIPGASYLTYPTTGQTNVQRAGNFTWATLPAAQAYYLTIGTAFGGNDLANSGFLPANQSSYSVSGLPSGVLYATLYTMVNGIWAFQAISFSTHNSEHTLRWVWDSSLWSRRFVCG